MSHHTANPSQMMRDLETLKFHNNSIPFSIVLFVEIFFIMYGIHKINQYTQFKALLLMKNIHFSHFSNILRTPLQPQHLRLRFKRVVYIFFPILNNVTESDFL